MQALWLEASVNDEQPSKPAVPEVPESVAQFFEREDPVPPHRRESVGEREQRLLRESFGGWCG
jgi:hypothetical protein